jgi:hypothetical protein
MNEILEILKETSRRLDHAGIPYMVTGSVALDFYVQPRMTRDVDIVVAVDPKDADKLFRAFSDGYYIDRGAVEDAVRTRGMVNAIHEGKIVKIDLIIRKNEEYRIKEFERRRDFTLEDGTVIQVVSPEDLLLSKLAWAFDSEFQLRDIRGIANTVSNLDLGYLRQWAVVLGVQERLEKVLQ